MFYADPLDAVTESASMTCYYGFDLSTPAMQTLRPLIKQAADDEWMDPDLKLELENLVCELTARLQHKGVYDLPD